MDEPRHDATKLGLAQSLRNVPLVLRQTTALVRSSAVLATLITVEFFWGFGLAAFEALTPAKLAEVMESTDQAATLFGPVVTVAFLVSAAGAASLPKLSDRIGPARAAMTMHSVQVVMLLGLALANRTIAVTAFYLLVMGAHGAINPAYQSLLHRQADPANRATVVSAASMLAHPGSSIGLVVLGALADRWSISASMGVGAAVLAVTVPLYLPARRQDSEAEAP